MSLIPDFYFRHIVEIPASLFEENGIKAAILDIDNTLTEDNSPVVAAEVTEWLAAMQANGIRFAVVSNNHNPRVSDFSKVIGIPAVCEAKKPDTKCLAEVGGILSTPPKETAVIGDQIFTDIWFAKRAGMKSILVEPMGPDGLIGIKIKRILEKPILWRMKRRGK